MHDTPAQWQYGRTNGAFCWCPTPAVPEAVVALPLGRVDEELMLGRVDETQTLSYLTILGSCVNRQGTSLMESACNLARRCTCMRRP